MTNIYFPPKVVEYLKTHRYQICIIGKYGKCEEIYDAIEHKEELLFTFICLEDADWRLKISLMYSANLIIVDDIDHHDEIIHLIEYNTNLKGTPILDRLLPTSETNRLMSYYREYKELNMLLWPYCMASIASRQGNPPQRRTRPTIICVDNCESNIILIETVLYYHNVEVVGCSSNQEALDILGSREVDVVVSDIDHVGDDADVLIETMREDPRYSLIPFIIHSARLGGLKWYSDAWKLFCKPARFPLLKIAILQFIRLREYLRMLE